MLLVSVPAAAVLRSDHLLDSTLLWMVAVLYQ